MKVGKNNTRKHRDKNHQDDAVKMAAKMGQKTHVNTHLTS